MSSYDEIAAQNRREAAEAVARAMGMTIPSRVVSQPTNVVSQEVKVPSRVVSQPASVVSQPNPVTLSVGNGASRQERWKRKRGDEWRTYRAGYMKRLRARLSSARNAPSTASAPVPGPTTADA